MDWLVPLETGLRQGLLLVPLAVGVHISFRFVRYPDLTPDGSALLGGALSAWCILHLTNPVLALSVGALSGGFLGLVTVFLSEVVGLDRILSGLASTLLAYSGTLRVLGRGNVAIPERARTLFGSGIPDLGIMVVVSSLIVLGGWLIFRSNFGLSVRATGENEDLVRMVRGNVVYRIAVGVFCGNFAVACSGGLLAQYERFSDVSQGAGNLFIGLACVLIGVATPFSGRLLPGLLASAGGAVVYAVLIALALRVGLHPGDLRGATAVLVVSVAATLNRIRPGERREKLFE